jgi:hypothetical protein
MSQIDVKVEVMRAAGLVDDDIVRLAWLRQRVLAGKCDDLTPEHKRLIYGKFLHDSGRCIG